MGEIEGWSHMGGGEGCLLPNGLLPNAGLLMESLDSERWLKAEERTAELINCIQPNEPSEERRNAVADYVQRLIMKCFPCQVFTFGSVPLKTYLPDGDIDLTAFSNNPNVKDSWASEVRDLLETEEKNENAEFHVKEVQYIQAEVKIIKCLVENIVVDISFNQLGGLCTLCFLEEVDNLISQNHLFKRSIILIKAWCYYESRILGAHHGLISTYALETLVLYIFHVFNNSFAGPLEVLYRFLEFFSNFDWDNFCVSLWGPVLISSLPDVNAEPPRKDSGELLLNKVFLDACSSVYAVFPGGNDNQGQQFLLKHFNVIDPLRVSNNLGRSVSKGNFFRIRSAFAFGAKRLARLLDCPKENIVAEVNQFFTNTWDRHGNGIRPDAPVINSLVLKISTDIRMSNSSGKKLEYVGQESDFEDTHSSNYHSESLPRTGVVNAVPHTQSQKRNGNLNGLKASDSVTKEAAPIHANKGQHILKSGHLLNDIQRSPFARTRSSPELTDTYKYVPFQAILNKAPESRKKQAPSGTHTGSSSNYHNRRNNADPESPSGRSSIDESSSLRHAPPHQSFDASVESSVDSNVYHSEHMHQEEQDLVNMMASSEFHSFNGQVHMPVNLASGHLPFPISSSFLASLGYTQRNLARMVPTNMPLMDPAFSGMQFPHGLVSPQLTHYFSGVEVMSHSEDLVGPLHDNNLVSAEINAGDDNHDYWQEPDRVNTENGTQDDKPQPSSTGMNYVSPPHCVGRSGGLIRNPQKNNKEKRERLRDNNHLYHSQNQENKEHSDERTMSWRYSSAAHSNSLRSKTSSESSWDEASIVSKSTKEKRGKTKVMPIELATSDHMQSEDDDQDTHLVSALVDRSSGPQAFAPTHVQRPHVPSIEPTQTSGAGSVIPMAPMIIGSNPRQRMMDNSTPLTFYPTGPPVPFLTMLPFYSVPSENGSLDASVSHFGVHESTDNGGIGQNFHSQGLDQSEDFSLRSATPGETSDEPHPDILNSDFASHWQNLQFGRFCQSPQHRGPNVYHSPVMVTPAYLQGRVPWDGPGRPLPNMNMVTQLMNYGPRLVPVAPLQSVPNRPHNVYQHYVEDMPRYRTGTGTYLPNPKVPVRERHSSGSRRGNYNSDRSDNHADREGNWNVSTKSRGSNRSHNRNQTDKSTSRLDRLGSSGSRSDRPMNSQRHDSYSVYQLQNGLSHLSSSQSSPANVTYDTYPLSASNLGVLSNGSNGPAVMMVYPFEQNAGFPLHNEKLEFGSLPAGFSGVSEQSPWGEPRGMLEEQRLYGASAQRSSPDQPLSPHCQRRV